MTRKTVKRLEWSTAEQRRLVLAYINGKTPTTTSARVQTWLAQCYHMPSKREQLMVALDDVCGTFGDEAVFSPNFSATCPVFSYLNTGDMYKATIVYRYDLARFQITTVGDLIEVLERKGYSFS